MYEDSRTAELHFVKESEYIPHTISVFSNTIATIKGANSLPHEDSVVFEVHLKQKILRLFQTERELVYCPHSVAVDELQLHEVPLGFFAVSKRSKSE